MRRGGCPWCRAHAAPLTPPSLSSLRPTLRPSTPQAQIANSTVAAVMGGVTARLFIGKFMDSAGPRKAFLLCLWGTAPFLLGIQHVRSFGAYAACRFFIAMALAAVIPCIQWTTQMYNVGVVGTANAIVGGWGNLVGF